MLGMCVLVLAVAGSGLGSHLVKPAADAKAAPAARDVQGVTEKEWVETILPWMRKVRPNQANVLDNMPEGSQKEKARQLVAEQYRDLMRIGNGAMQKARLDEIKAQDDLFGAQIKFRAARRSGLRGPKLEEARVQVQVAVERVFDALIAKKKVQLDRIQSEINGLEKNRATYVANWTRGAINQGRNAANATVAPRRPESSPGEVDSASKP
jgi:hypothetical protein